MADTNANNRERSKPYRLSDIFGLQVMVAALGQLVEFEIDHHSGLYVQSKYFDLKIKFQHYSALLCIPESAIKKARRVTIRDFQFFPAELFKYQRLVFFVSQERPDNWPMVDRETPIALNKDVDGAGCFYHLVDDWIEWHNGKDSALDPADPSGLGSDVNFVVFRELFCNLWGGGAGNIINSASREFDATHDAARYAMQQMEEGCSDRADIEAALEKYPQISKREAKELNFQNVVSTNIPSAKKKVQREVARIIKEDK